MQRRSVLDLLDMTPFWLYEVLPALYMLSGLITFALLDHVLAYVSAGLLIGCGAYVSWMRWRARRRQVKQQRDPEVVLLGMSWMRNYLSGHALMDEEHRELFELSHEILASMLAGRGSEVDELLGELCESVERHFRNEEDILYQSEASGLRAHRRAHHRLVSQLQGLRSRHARGQIPRAAVIQFLLHDMIRGHMVSDDIGTLEEITRSAPTATRQRRTIQTGEDTPA